MDAKAIDKKARGLLATELRRAWRHDHADLVEDSRSTFDYNTTLACALRAIVAALTPTQERDNG